jgi:hypothetical protein
VYLKGRKKMNVAAIESMEEFARTVLKLPQDAQKAFFEKLAETLSEAEVETLKKCVGIYHLMTTPSLYKGMQKALGDELYKEFNA